MLQFLLTVHLVLNWHYSFLIGLKIDSHMFLVSTKPFRSNIRELRLQFFEYPFSQQQLVSSQSSSTLTILHRLSLQGVWKKWCSVYFANISATKFRIFKLFFSPENPYANFEYKTISVHFRGWKLCKKKLGLLMKGLWSKLKLFNSEVLYILKPNTIKTVLTVCVTRPIRRPFGAIRACLWPIAKPLSKFWGFEATMTQHEYELICFRIAFSFVHIPAP